MRVNKGEPRRTLRHMQGRPGTFIVLEGTDGSGKGTQFALLCERLRQAGYDIATFDFPQYDEPSSYFVTQYLNGLYGTAAEVGPYTASLFYALDRYEAAPKIREALNQGKIVVSNRFTGSSMGHQGTKFRSPEERRGYFIWLDNIEFELLRIPRPDISFVLRVPAEIAQQLVDKKAPRAYTDQKRDIHEADLSHLEKALEVYDDLTQLFPKDFQRIDCVRNNKLLDIDTIQNMLWEKIAPLLPPPPQLEMAMKDKTETASSSPVAPPLDDLEGSKASGTPSVAVTSLQLSIEHASSLLAQRLQQTWFVDYKEQPLTSLRYDQKNASGNYQYYVPAELSAPTAQQYRTTMDQLFVLYTEMLQKLTIYLAQNSPVPKERRDDAWKYTVQTTAYEALQAVLPAAIQTPITIPAESKALSTLIVRLLTDELPEARIAGELLLGELRTKAPHLLEAADFAARTSAIITYRATTYAMLKKLAKAYLPDNHAAETIPVQLSSVWPRNEMELIPDMLYQYGSLPLATLRDEVTDWPYSRKLEIFRAYIGNRKGPQERPGSALKKAHYTWDLVSEYGIFRELQRHRIIGTIAWQPLTPRYGYDIPQLIEAAGIEEQYERCFDISLQLYSALQQAGYEREAQYATLLGHKIRWTVAHTAHEAFRLHELDTKPNVQKLLTQMHEKLAEVHPLLAESMQFSSTKTEALIVREPTKQS